MKNVFLDTNICLDVIMNRQPFAEDAKRIFEMGHRMEIALYASSVCFTTIYYVLNKQYGTLKAFSDLKKLRRFVSVTAVNATVIDLAIHSSFSDFEDAVQYFSAKESDMNLIITRNAKDFESASIKVLTPKQFLFPKNQ